MGSISFRWISPLGTSTWNVYTLCGRVYQNVAQRVCDFQIELPNIPIHLKIALPLWNAYGKSSTGGVWVSNGVIHWLLACAARQYLFALAVNQFWRCHVMTSRTLSDAQILVLFCLFLTVIYHIMSLPACKFVGWLSSPGVVIWYVSGMPKNQMRKKKLPFLRQQDGSCPRPLAVTE